MIGYHRSNKEGFKTSDYYRSPITDPASLLPLLTQALGVDILIEKERIPYLYGSTGIHIDKVLPLGFFVELETVLPLDASPSQEEQALDEHQTVIELLRLAALPVVGDS